MTDLSVQTAAPMPQAIPRVHPLMTKARAIIRLALPIMGIALVNMGMSVTATFMVLGAFGAGALAAVAVGSDFQSILF
jgi:multidrug resistance protein, MATE family